jgi:hypothetical protein
MTYVSFLFLRYHVNILACVVTDPRSPIPRWMLPRYGNGQDIINLRCSGDEQIFFRDKSQVRDRWLDLPVSNMSGANPFVTGMPPIHMEEVLKWYFIGGRGQRQREGKRR